MAIKIQRRKGYIFTAVLAVMVFIPSTLVAEAQHYSLLAYAPSSSADQQKLGEINNQAALTYLQDSKLAYSFYFDPLTNNALSTVQSGNLLRSASLLKLPEVMDLYRMSEDKIINLDQEATIEPGWLNETSGSLWMRGPGSKISLREAARLALVDSDNTAANVVKFFVAQNFAGQDILNKLNTEIKVDKNGKAYTSASSYSSILKCLYISCYLSKGDSEYILNEMTQTNSPGIRDGVPTGILVAHKFGATENSYADCGIIYYPNHPYLMCLMLGAKRPVALPVMAKVSNIVYQAVAGATAK
jgi:beta-lactamase class A